jgi:hypothetical protein
MCSGKAKCWRNWHLLYVIVFFDFNYYELYEEHLTGANYRKLPYGPVPQNLDIIRI